MHHDAYLRIRTRQDCLDPSRRNERRRNARSGTSALSIARMVSPSGWSEPAQTPSFDEFTVVLRGQLQAETLDAVHQVSAGQAIWVGSGEWIHHSTPGPEGAEYIAVCLPAFSPETVHRDEH